MKHAACNPRECFLACAAPLLPPGNIRQTKRPRLLAVPLATSTWWILFNVFVLLMLAVDLGIFHRKAHEVTVREALAWCAVWVAIALLFGLGLYLGWIGHYEPAQRWQATLEFLTGYLIEESLSVDNVFVIALILGYFKVPAAYQHRVLFWGVLGALVMRAGLILAGIALLQSFHWIMYIFGGILIASGAKMWSSEGQQFDPEKNPVLRFIRRILPMSRELDGPRFFTRASGSLLVTPLLVVLIFVEWSDLIFALDSIPAILAITDDPFIVYTSNVLAILGLRSLYFAVVGILGRFHLLHYGLSALLVFIGAKMLAVDFFKIPITLSLLIVASILAISVVASLLWPQRVEETA